MRDPAPRDLSSLYRKDEGLLHCRICSGFTVRADHHRREVTTKARPQLLQHAEVHLADGSAVVEVRGGIERVVPTDAIAESPGAKARQRLEASVDAAFRTLRGIPKGYELVDGVLRKTKGAK